MSSIKVIGGVILTAAVALGALAYSDQLTYTVEQSDRASLRQFGKVITEDAIQPGLHWKVPFITKVDTIQVSMTPLEIPRFTVTTADNQPLEIEANIQYVIPDTAIFHILYGIEKSGSAGDLKQNILKVAEDRISRVFASKQTTTVAENRETIQAAVQKEVGEALTDLFYIKLVSLQLPLIKYSDTFVKSNESVIRAKNEAAAESSKVATEQYKADQKVKAAEGEARQAIAAADGKAKSIKMAADADAYAILANAKANSESLRLRGDGESLRLKAEAEALGGPVNYTAYIEAQGHAKWTGGVPASVTILGDKVPVFAGMPLNANK